MAGLHEQKQLGEKGQWARGWNVWGQTLGFALSVLSHDIPSAPWTSVPRAGSVPGMLSVNHHPVEVITWMRSPQQRREIRVLGPVAMGCGPNGASKEKQDGRTGETESNQSSALPPEPRDQRREAEDGKYRGRKDGEREPMLKAVEVWRRRDGGKVPARRGHGETLSFWL